MKLRYSMILCMLLALMLPAARAKANLGEYGFSVTQGEYIDISGDATEALGPSADDLKSGALEIGFTFYFDGIPYQQFSVSSNGLIGLGPVAVSPCWVNQLTTPNGLCDFVNGYDFTLETVPHLAAYWDDLRVANSSPNNGDPADPVSGTIRYKTVGEAPNRILVVDFSNVETWYRIFDPAALSTWQVRLYEGSNRIEYYYEYLSPVYDHNGGTIGLAADPSNFISVTPDGSFSASTSTSRPNDFYYPSEVPIEPGTMYVFSPCQLIITGDEAQGGTKNMNFGDEILTGMKGDLGVSTTFYPFSIGVDGGCSERGFSIALGGEHASEYSIEPMKGSVFGGEPTYPAITFTPTGSGVRRAQITITDDKGNSKVYNLAAEGNTRIQWIGDIQQGGTAEMLNGDVLMSAIHLPRLETANYTPFTLLNFGQNSELPPAEITYSIKGISGGQYSIMPPMATIGSGETSTPTVTFTPTGVGPILDSLIVVADGERRAFALKAISDAPGGEFYLKGALVTSETNAFNNEFSCVGTGPVTLPLLVRNIGNQPFEIQSVDFFLTDTTYRQGAPRYELLRDGMENPIPSYDYIVTEQPPVAPYTMGGQSFPIVIPTGESRTLYFTLISQLPGKRFARAYIHTNGETGSAIDVNGETVEGLVTFDLFGRGMGGALSDNPNGGLPKGVVFTEAKVGTASDATLTLFNTGTCDLRVAMKSFKFTSGDIDEFTVTSVPTPATSTIDEQTGDLVLAPGASASVGVRFTPSQTGSRRATMRLETNDSTIQYPGLTERGSYYVDFYGGGSNGLYANSLTFGMALIGGTGGDQLHGVVTARNVSSVPVTITSATIEGPDAAEFTQDAATPWPTAPFVIMPTSNIDFGVVFAPATGGQTGARNATLKLVTSTGETITSPLSGTAGTRTVAVTPSTLNFAVSIGKTTRRSVMIANTGTMPLTLTAPVLGGANAADYGVGALPRLVLEPGQSEYLEISFTPTSTSASGATLTIGSNAVGGPMVITLNGATVKTKLAGGDPSQSATAGRDANGAEIFDRADDLSVLGVNGESFSNGVALRQSVPNPARDVVEIGYRIPARGAVELALYDASGRLVRTLASGVSEAGEQTVRLNVSDLASGVYHYRLIANGQTLSRTLSVVH